MQRSILFGEEKGGCEDDSIQIHSALSKLDEVELLKRELCWLMQQESILPQEILVLVCDLPSYAPLIQAVFSAEPCPVPFHLTQQKSEQEPLLQLLTLHRQGCRYRDVCALLETTAFQKKWEFTKEEIVELKKLFDSAEVDSGWQEGLDRLLYGLVKEPDERLECFPIAALAHTQIDLLNRFLTWWELIATQSRLLVADKSIAEWIDLFVQMANDHFVFSEEEKRFLATLEQLKQRGHFDPTVSFSFDTALSVLKQCLSSSSSGSLWDRVIIASIDALHLPPAQVIWCMGVDEEKLPRAGTRSSFHQIDLSVPSPQDIQRYVLLEALLKAKSRLYFSFERMDSQDAKEKKISLLVEEIQCYVKEQKIPIRHHYSLPVRKQEAPAPFFSVHTAEAETSAIIKISGLKKCARSALQLYTNEHLGIVLSRAEDAHNEKFALTALDKALWRKELHTESPSFLLSKKKAQGKLPQGAFAELALNELASEAKEFHQALTAWKLAPHEIKNVRFVQGLRAPQQNCYPLLQCGRVLIEGVLEGVTPQGLLYDGECDEQGLMRALPLYLMYRTVVPNQPYILFAKDGQKLQLANFCTAERLSAYVQFYELALQSCCPFTASNGKYFLNNDKEKFEAFLHKDQDPYVELFRRRQSAQELLALFDKWQPMVASLFEGLT
jgi:exonuclease V gamma subunit